MIGKKVEVYTPITIYSTGKVEYIRATGTVVDVVGKGDRKRILVSRSFIGGVLKVKPEEIKKIL